MPFPNDLNPLPTTMQGTTATTDAIDDHALMHRELGSAVNALASKLGLPAGTPSANQIFLGQGAGTANWGTVWNQANLGSPSITGGTVNNPVIGTAAMVGGTWNGAVLGTPTIGTITVQSGSALGFSAAIAPGVGTITDSAGGTFIVDARTANIFYCAMSNSAGNRTIGTPTNPTGYQQLTFAFKDGGGANGTLVWSGIFRMSQDVGTPVIGTGSSWTYIGWRYNPIDSRWDFQGRSANIL